MKMRDIVKKLRNEGHSVSYYVRKDGGILIQSIDGQRFTGGTGNMYARAMTGTTLSTKRASQLSKITWEGERAKSQIADREIKKQLEKVQKKWRQAFPHKRGEVPAVGLKTAKKVKWSLEHRGKEETQRLLSEAERYASGKAYTKNIELLIDRINDYITKYNSLYPNIDISSLESLRDDIIDNSYLIREDGMQKAYEELYELDHGASPEEVSRNVRRVLGLVY